MEYHIAKGVFDILPEDPDEEGVWRESHRWQFIEKTARETAELYGFQEIRTPLFESTSLFERSIGKNTDVVSKEMYSFLDKGQRPLTLRPEGTASVMRAFLEKRLYERTKRYKYYYLMPMFRYERQQSGRYRQHHQFGVEAIGSPSPYQDAEVIDLLFTFLRKLTLKDLTLHINSIGTEDSRELFRQSLKRYLEPHKEALSEDSKNRFETNPLRILDSKDPTDRAIIKEAPCILDFLDPLSKAHFDTLLNALDQLHIPYKINPLLVRGLDYYTSTVFEVTAMELGSQNSIGGGGRYDGLIKELGGPDLPAFGFGSGIERLIQTMLGQGIEFPEPPRALLYIIPLGELAQKPCSQLLHDLREAGVPSEMDLSGKKLKNAMQFASGTAVHYVTVIGENELATKKVKIKEMKTGQEEEVFLDHLVTRMKHVKL